MKCSVHFTLRPQGASGSREVLCDHGLAKGEHPMTYTAEIRRVGGSLYKTARGSSNLFLPDTCFSNTVRPVWA